MEKSYRVVNNEDVLGENKMSVNEFGIKIGDKVEVLYFEEEMEDAPDDYIGSVGEVFSLNETASGEERNIGVRFEGDYRYGFNEWDFSPEQLKLVKTN